ncbi:MAG TPA: AbrB family transcriptional regulator [Bordetella sp.]
MIKRLAHTLSAWLQSLARPIQWLILLALSSLFLFALERAGLPAGILLGPLVAGAILSILGVRLQLPRRLGTLIPGVVGCMIVKLMPSSGFGQIADHLPVFLFGTFAVIIASGFLGWVMTRMRILPGTTALWGLSPGAASAMVLMAEAYGADTALVALMQYLRVLLVTSITASVATLAGASHMQHAAISMGSLSDVAWLPLAETLVLALGGAALGRALRVPGGTMLLPMVLAFIFGHSGLVELELPRGLLLAVYALLGWRIGFRFTAPLLAHAARAMPRIILATLILMALCGALAGMLVLTTGIDPLSAYLATSPGGVDSVAIIAASTHVDVTFVMGMQTVRFLGVLLLGPIMVRLLARSTQRDARPT